MIPTATRTFGRARMGGRVPTRGFFLKIFFLTPFFLTPFFLTV
jgi:hypothetical protein